MYFIFIILIILLLIIRIFSYLINRQKRNHFLKAGKKWDEIVEELKKRK